MFGILTAKWVEWLFQQYVWWDSDTGLFHHDNNYTLTKTENSQFLQAIFEISDNWVSATEFIHLKMNMNEL